jgi:hypothetical protein
VRNLVLRVLMLAGTCFSQQSSPARKDDSPLVGIPVLTVCQALRDAARYAVQPVILVGRSIGTEEGSWLDESCGLNVVIEGRKYPTSISTSYPVSEFAPPPSKPRDFKWD